MTYQTKAALREEIADLRWKLDLSEDKVAARFEFEAFQEEILRHAKVHAATVATRETLALVLQALKIPDYTSFVEPNETKLGSKVRVTLYDTARFRMDLEAVLSARAEKKQAAEDAATEARVAGLAKGEKGEPCDCPSKTSKGDKK